jgi:hypothetical protein
MASLSFRVNETIAAEVRGAVFSVEKFYPAFSREVLLRRGLELVLEELRREHNNGRRFEPLMRNLRTGQRRNG